MDLSDLNYWARGSVAYDRDPPTGPDLPMPPRDHDYAEQTAAEIDKEVRAIVQTAMNRALEILREKRTVQEMAGLLPR